MDCTSFLNLIKNSIKIINNLKNRPKDSKGKPGSLILSPNNFTPIIIGDLHGAVNNLKAIINHENNIEKIKNKEAILIIIGDALHNDQTGQMLEMQSSFDSLE